MHTTSGSNTKILEFRKLRSNLRNPRDAIAVRYARMQTDCESYGNDRAILKTLQAANPQNIAWHELEAKNLLKLGVNKGKHLHQVKPTELYASSRKEYQHFLLKVFRNHIYQEVNSRSKHGQQETSEQGCYCWVKFETRGGH
jgi:hypothetical protein